MSGAQARSLEPSPPEVAHIAQRPGILVPLREGVRYLPWAVVRHAAVVIVLEDALVRLVAVPAGPDAVHVRYRARQSAVGCTDAVTAGRQRESVHLHTVSRLMVSFCCREACKAVATNTERGPEACRPGTRT